MDSRQLNEGLKTAIARISLENTTEKDFEEVKAIALNLLEQNRLLKEMLGRHLRP